MPAVVENNFPAAFQYLLPEHQYERICFGSGLPRKTCIEEKDKNASSVGPGSYDLEITSLVQKSLNKIRSKKGVAGIASAAPRFKDAKEPTPAPGQYDFKSQFSPKLENLFFIKKRTRKYPPKVSDIPAPNTYHIQDKINYWTKKQYNFGKPTIPNVVEMICVAMLTDRCNKCNNLCENDYWQYKHKLFLCHLCWVEETSTFECFTPNELHRFRKIRNCHNIHRHEGAPTAAVRIMTPRTLKKRLNVENYLDMYLKVRPKRIYNDINSILHLEEFN